MNVRVAVLLTMVVGTGVWVRSLSQPTIATLYFPHGDHLVPVSRRLAATGDVPRATLQALIDGPRTSSGLTSPFHAGVQINAFALSNGVARLDLSSGFNSGEDASAATAAIVETLTAVPGVRAVSLSVGGRPASGPSTRTPLLYYASMDGLTAVPTASQTARDAVAAYLRGPGDRALTGIPGDVRLLKYAFAEDEGVASLDFSYTQAVRTLAIEKPDIMRSVLLGLIASLTEYPEVRAVRIDFDGHSRLGFGECSDLLRTPQRRPRLLNDERLLGR
jgi:spore germination protein GerM